MMAQDVSFNEIEKRIKEFHFPDADVVVGIATGGTVPAALVAFQLGLPFHLIRINYRAPDNQPQHPDPVLYTDLPNIRDTDKILLVDDVSVSGKTFDFAKSLFTGYKIITFALKGNAEQVLMPELSTCVNWPWSLTKR